jgi:predicted PurR-regulated permease PerM
MTDQVDDKFKSRVIFMLLAITAVGLSFGLVWIGRVVFLLLFAAIVGTIFLTAVTEWLHERLKIKQGAALALFILVALALVALLVWIQGPNAVEQFSELSVELPLAAHSLLTQLQSHTWGRWLLSQSPDSQHVSNGFSFALNRIGGIVLSSATIIAGLIIVLSLSIYMSAEPETYYNGVRRIVPEEYREKLDACTASVAQILRSWVIAKLISMSMVGVLVTIGLWIVGVPLSFSLGVIAALMTFIPNIGPLIAVIPATLLALAKSPTTGLLALLVYAIVYALEGYVVTPLLERNIVRLPPALTLTMQLLLAAVAGPVGVALAAPFAAAILGLLSVLLPKAPEVSLPKAPEPPPRTKRLRAR